VSFSHLSKLNSVHSRNPWQKHIICILSVWIALFPAFAFALPTDPTVQAGSVTFDQVDPNTLNVIQSTNKAIIDWQSFNIQADEATHFQMPSSDSFNLSRVTGGVGTEIFGTLTSNGNLMLLNPNGILFGANSKIDVGGLIATTSNITNSNFMAGNYQFDIPSSVNRTVINRGVINVAQGGLLAFVAPGVENSGIINAQLGQVSLASGKTFTLDLYGDKLVSLGVDSKVLNQVIGPDGQPVSSLVKNGGSIFANGGTVFLEVNAARDIVDHVINMDGLIEAKSAVQENGEIILLGGDEGLVNVNGTLDASGKDAGQTGGEVQVLGEWVALLENAFIDVSGDLGGGTALIGGDYGGKGLVPTAEKTYFHSTAFVTADALSSGDGGKVILWADDATYFYGGVSATGGLQSGNGGFVETSGKKYLDFDGSVDVGAVNGEGGTVLLDPASITLLSGVDSNSTGFTAGSDISELFAEDSAAVTVLNPDAGGSFDGISAGSTIILQATDFITVSNDFILVTATGSANNSLVMQAGGAINVNANITLDGTGTIHLEADSVHSTSGGADGTGALNIAATKTITTINQSVTLIGADFGFSGSIDAGSGNVAIAESVSSSTLALGSATGTLLSDAELDNITTTGTLTIGQATTAGSDGAGTGASTLTSGAITTDGLTLSQNIALISDSTVDLGASTLTGTLSVTSTGGAITDSGALAVTGATTISASGFDVTLDNASNNFAGAVSVIGANVQLVDAGAINLGASTVSGTYAVTATAGGDITDSGVLAITGASTFTAGNGQSVTLDSASTYTGAVSFVGTTLASVTINDSGAFDLGALTLTGNLSVTAAGAVTQTGALAITGTTTVSASGFDVTFGDATNNFAGAVGITGANVSVVDAGDLVLGPSTVSGTYAATATAAGDITNTGALAITGAATFTAANGQSITVANASNNFSSAVVFSSGGTLLNVSVLDTTTIDLAALSVSGTLTVSSGGDITQSGALTVAGISSFTSTGTNNDILLSTTTNALTGAVSLATAGTTGDVTIDNGTTVLNLGTVTANGNLSVTGGGGITDSGVITVAGTSLFNSDVAAQVITLDSANAMTGAVSITHTGAADVSIDNGTTALNLGTISVGQNFSATSGGVISDSGVITVAGTGTFITDVNDIDIVLDNVNAITGALTFTTQTAGGNGADVTLNNGSTAISLAAFTTEGNLTLTTTNAAAFDVQAHTVNGNLAVTTGGAITQTGALTVSGTSGFTAGAAGAITLGTATNALTGAVSLANSGAADIAIDNGTTALNLGTISAGQNFSATSGGGITGSGVITVAGTSLFNSDVAAQVITLDSANAMTGAVSITHTGAADVSIDNGTTALNLGTVSVGQNFSATSGGGITDSGVITVAGTSSFTADVADQVITLDTTTNAMTGAISISTLGTNGNVILDNGTTAINLGTITANGTLNVRGGAGITDSGVITVSGTSLFNSDVAAQVITLDSANAMTGAVSITHTGAADVAIDNGTTALNLGTVSVGQNFSATSGGGITDSGVITVAGTSSFTADVADQVITLDTTTNAMTGAISISTLGTNGNVILDNGTTAINLGTITANGTLNVRGGAGITDSGVITVSGTSLFNSDVAAQVITLDSANAMTGAVSITHTGAADVAIDNGTTALNLGTISVGQNFSATSGGVISDSGVITVAGTATFVTDVDDTDIILNSANAITGAITFTTQSSGANGADVTLNNGSTAISLAAFTTEGNLTLETTQAIALAGVTVNGDLSAVSGAAITQTGALTVSGTSNFNSTGTDTNITIDTTTNALTGAVTVTSTGTSGDVSIDNGTTALALQGTVNGALTVVNGAAITDSGTLTVSGTSSFTIDSGSNDIILGTAELAGAIGISTTGTSNFTLDNTNTAVNLGTVGVTGNLSVTTGSTIIDSGVLTITGTSSFTTDVTGQAITLDTTTNAMTGAVSFTHTGAADVSIDNGTTALDLGTITVGQNFEAISGGGITDSGVITVAGTSLFNSDVAAQVITLDSANAMTGAVSITHTGAADVSIDNGTTALILGTVGVGQNFSATSGGGITDSGVITVAGTGTFITDVNDIDIVLDSANAITGAVSFITQTGGTNGADVTFNNGTTAISLAAFTTEGNLTLETTQAINVQAYTVNGNLSVTSSGAITQTGALTVSGTSGFTAGAAGAITLGTTTNALTGAVSLANSGAADIAIDNGTTALNLGTVSAGQNFSAISGGGITDSGVITVAGTSLFNSDVAAQVITLDSVNAMTGAVSITHTGAADVSIDNGTTALNLGTVSVGQNFEAISGGGITDSGVITVAGTSLFNSDVAAQVITLDTTTNAMTGAVSITHTGAADVSIDNGTTALDLGTVSVGQNFEAISGGGISDSGVITVAGTSLFNSDVAAQTITLDSVNAMTGAVSITHTGAADVSIDNGTTALDLGTVSVGQNFEAISGGGITDSGVITVAGTSLFNSDVAAQVITLDTTTNAMTGAVSITHTGAADVSIDNGTTALDLGTVSVGQNFEAISGGGITDSGVITVAGTSLFNSDVAAQVITLDSANAMTGAVSITHTGAADVSIDNGTTVLDLGTVGVGQNFSATSGGGITDSGVITVAGTGTFITDVDDIDIVLDSSNVITGALTFTTQSSGANGANVTFDNGSTAISLAAFTTEGNLTLTTTNAAAFDVAAHTVNGNLAVTTGGAITQTGALTVSGTSSFTAGAAGAITLGTTTNALTGAVSLANSGAADIALDNGTTALNLGTVSAGQNLSVVSGGGITDSGVITVAGTSSFNSDLAAQVITLDSVNAMTGAVSITHTGAADVSIDNGTTALNLGTVSVGQNFEAISGGGITDSGVIIVAGTSLFNSDVAAQVITLDTTTNAMTGAVSITHTGAADVSIDNGTTALNLGTVSVGQNFEAISGGGITDSGVIIVAGTSLFNSDVAGQVITLDTTTNAMTGAVSITHTGAADVSIDNGTTALNLGTVSVGQNFSATSGSPITQSGSLAVAGTATFTTDTGDTNITLDNTSNAITGAITFITQSSGTNNADIVLDNGSTAISLAAFTTEGDLTLQSDAAIALAGHTVNGNLVVTSDAGAITQSAALTVSGTSSFTTTTAGDNITLSTTTNAFTGAVSISTSGTADVAIDNGTTALNLGTVAVGQNLTATSGDVITDSGVITVGGTAAFTTDVTDKAITLDSQNVITGAITFATMGTGGDVSFDNGTTAISLGSVAGLAGDLTLLTDAAQTISSAISLTGTGASLSITVDNGNSLNVQAVLTTGAGNITLSADDDVIFTAAGDLTSTSGNISVIADDDATSDAGSGGALTMADGTVFDAGSGTLTGIADEDITLGQMTTTNATTSAITLNTASGNILDGGDTDEDLTAASGTVAVTTGGGTFGTDANAIEITSAALSTSGVPVVVVNPEAAETLEGTSETVGEASVDQTINIVENLVNAVESGNQVQVGSGASTVAVNIAPQQPGPGPVVVDVFSEDYKLVKAGDSDLPAGVEQLNNIFTKDDEEEN
jgi:filamentous hemagglutinin family protein